MRADPDPGAQRSPRIDGVTAVQVDFNAPAHDRHRPRVDRRRRPSGTAPTSPAASAQGRGRRRRHPRHRHQPGQPVLRGLSRRRRRRLRPHQPARRRQLPRRVRPRQHDSTTRTAAATTSSSATTTSTGRRHDGSTTTTATAPTPPAPPAGNRSTPRRTPRRAPTHEFSVTSTHLGRRPARQRHRLRRLRRRLLRRGSIVAAIDQAIADGVDVINYSIGSSRRLSPWNDFDTVGFLNARAAGIRRHLDRQRRPRRRHRSAPPPTPRGSPRVGATTHNRQYVPPSPDITATDAATLPDIAGAGLSGATDGAFPSSTPAPRRRQRPCAASRRPGHGRGPDAARSSSATAAATAASRRATNVADARRRGHDPGQRRRPAATRSTVTRTPSRPRTSPTPTARRCKASWPPTRAPRRPCPARWPTSRTRTATSWPRFSSRGPNRAVVVDQPVGHGSRRGHPRRAPASTTSVEWDFISGTSMASPHTAGALRPPQGSPARTGRPAEAQSALMTTAERDITDSDGTAADWFDMGSGRIELRKAAKAGLVLDENLAGYQARRPGQGWRRPRAQHGQHGRRRVPADVRVDPDLHAAPRPVSAPGRSRVENLSDGLTLDADETSIAVTDGGDRRRRRSPLTVDNGTPTDTWLFGTLVLTPPAGSDGPGGAPARGACCPRHGVLPTSIDVTTRRDAGSQLETDLEAISITDLQIDASGLVPEETHRALHRRGHDQHQRVRRQRHQGRSTSRCPRAPRA